MSDGNITICSKCYLAFLPFTRAPPKPSLCQRCSEFHHRDLNRPHSRGGKIDALSLSDGTDAPQFGRSWIRRNKFDNWRVVGVVHCKFVPPGIHNWLTKRSILVLVPGEIIAAYPISLLNDWYIIYLVAAVQYTFNPLTPNVNYSGRTAPLTSKVAFYIFIQQI